jgi:hypothetical protein
MKSDAEMIFETYIRRNHQPILESSIAEYDTSLLSDLYKWDLDCIDNIVNEGFSDIASSVKNFAANVGNSIWKKIANALVSRLSPEEKNKLEDMIQDGDVSKTPETSKIANELKSEPIIEDSFNNHLFLFDTFLTEKTISLLSEAAKKPAYVPLSKRSKSTSTVPTIKSSRAAKTKKSTPSTASTTPAPATVKVPSELKNIRKAIISYLATKKSDKQKANAYYKLDQSIRKTFDQNITSILNSTANAAHSQSASGTAPVTPSGTSIPKASSVNKSNDNDVIEYISNALSTVSGDKRNALDNFITSVKSEFKTKTGENAFQMPKTTYINDVESGTVTAVPPKDITLPPELEQIKPAIVDYVTNQKPDSPDKIKFFTKLGLVLGQQYPHEPEDRPDPVININGVTYPNPNAKKKTPNAQNTPTVSVPAEQKGLISRVYKWIKDHPNITAASIIGLSSAITAATGGTVALIPLLKAALTMGAIGAGVETGKQLINNKGMDIKKIGGAALKGAAFGSAARGISDIADSWTTPDYSDDVNYLNDTEDQDMAATSPEEDVAKAEPVDNEEDVVKAEPVSSTPTKSEFKKLTGTEFDPNSTKDRKVAELIGKLKSQNKMHLFDKLSDQINQKYGIKTESYVNSLKW